MGRSAMTPAERRTERAHQAALDTVWRIRYARAAGMPTRQLEAALQRYRTLAKRYRRLARKLAAP
jgi:hypothetical protein